METVVLYYCVFALATSVTTLIRFYLPVLRAARAQGVSNSVTNNPVLGVVVYVVITFFLAPVVFSTLIVNTHGTQFMNGLYKSMVVSDE